MGAARHLTAGLIAASVGSVALAQGKAPAPEFSVEMSFQSIMARQLADGCDTLDFDHAGFDRHMRALIGEFSNRGIDARNRAKQFAPIQPERYRPYFDAFVAKYDLREESPDEDFCAAAAAEAERRTPIGRMLKGVAQ